jgi:putative protein-disulfide isomerase
MKPLLIYCYDAYCGWCYGFSPVIKKIAAAYSNWVNVEVLSGGMLTGAHTMPIEKIGPYIQTAYKQVENLTGIEFGEDFLWHVFNYDKSDWVMNSEKPAIALSILKDIYPERQIDFVSDLQYALNYEGRDLDDNEAYRHLLAMYNLQPDDFYAKLANKEYKEKAQYEFALCRQLKADSFPQVFLQVSDTKFYAIAKGYTAFEEVQARIDAVLKENN